jgi:hypothetical protein
MSDEQLLADLRGLRVHVAALDRRIVSLIDDLTKPDFLF